MAVDKERNAMPQGSLDMLILRTLVDGPKHGYAIARHLHVASNQFFQIEEGSLYPALHRLAQRGMVSTEWGPSETNRKAKFYALTAAGKRSLKEQTNAWLAMQQAIASIMNVRLGEAM